MKFLFALITACCLINIAKANDQMRQWTFTSGEQETAEIIAFDESTRIVTLRKTDQTILKLEETEFSSIDRAWILQWIELDEEARDMLNRVGGTVTHEKTTGEFATDYYVYHPAPDKIPAGTKPPMMMLFHPGGNGGRVIYRYVEAAAANGFALVSFDHFRNTQKDEAAFSDEMDTRFAAILPQVEANVPHDPQRVYMGGTSGGALRAYRYAVLVDRPWAGVFAAGGWLGYRPDYKRDYPPLLVAMVNGDKDDAANHYIKRDTEMLQSTGSIVSIHAFEGGHQMPPPSVISKAFRWLLETELPDEAAP